jgi:hypothetical protein
MGNRASPLMRCNYPSYTSAVYSHSCIPTVRSYTQYNLTEHQLLNFMVPFKTVPKTRQIDRNTAPILPPLPPSRAVQCEGKEWHM